MEHSLLQLTYAQVSQDYVLSHFSQSINVTLIHLSDIVCIAFTFVFMYQVNLYVLRWLINKYPLTRVFFCMLPKPDTEEEAIYYNEVYLKDKSCLKLKW